MKSKIISLILWALLAPTYLFAANTPIQRLDVANLLWNSTAGGNGGFTNTAVIVEFSNGGLAPCFSTTLPFQATITVWAGLDFPCVTPITNVSVTPIETLPLGLVYLAPENTLIQAHVYSTQMLISQLSPPLFDPDNATLMSPGTVITTTTIY